MLKVPTPKVLTKFIPFEGGLDSVTPTVAVASGRVKASQNVYQDINGGYTTFQGYERFDGQTAPSAATYTVLTCTITGTIAVGDTLTGGTGLTFGGIEVEFDGDTDVTFGGVGGISGGSGQVIAVESDAVILTKVVGSFPSGEIFVSGVSVGSTTGSAVIDGASTAYLRAIYKNATADVYRADITTIPGSGDVLGVWYFGGYWYGFRNNTGATAAVMHKNSTSGWTEVALGLEVSFTLGGVTVPSIGDVITGTTSGATATLTGVVLQSSSWASSAAVGKFTFASQSGSFEAEVVEISGVGVATLSGDSSAITLQPSGSYKFKNGNFTGLAANKKMYGCDGVNPAFEFDGTAFVQIATGMTDDTPQHLDIHKYQLFLFFDGEAQHSAPGYPYQWSVVVGAGALGLGDTVTGSQVQPGTGSGATLSIFTRNQTTMLYGSSTDDWLLVPYKNEVGGFDNTIQQIGNTFFLSDRGIVRLSTAQEYGNFNDATVSKLIQPWLATKKAKTAVSCIVRDKNQYWTFFDDKSAICCTVMDGNIVSMMPMLFKHTVTCVASIEDESGVEQIMFGSDDGYVRHLYKGTSFDGDSIEWFFDMHYDHFNSPLIDKRYRSGNFEVFGVGYATFDFSYSLGYGSTEIAQPVSAEGELQHTEVLWDTFTWDAFVWDGSSLSPVYFRTYGTAENISLTFRSESDFYSPLRFSGAFIQYTPTREKR